MELLAKAEAAVREEMQGEAVNTAGGA